MRFVPFVSQLCLSGIVILGGCVPTEITGKNKEGGEIKLAFYPGGTKLDDLVIISGINYFGKAQYQMDDPIGDIGFRLNSGERVQAECTEIGKDLIGNDECKSYTVYRSSFLLIPEGSVFRKPEIY